MAVWPASRWRPVNGPVQIRQEITIRESLPRKHCVARPTLHRMATATSTAAVLAKAYDPHGPRSSFPWPMRMRLATAPAAEDVTQDIFVQVWRQAGKLRHQPRQLSEAWTGMMIARTRVLDRLRSHSSGGIVLKPVGDNLPDAPDAEDWPEDLAISRENAVNVRMALAELPDDQKHAIEMAFFDGLTHVEISEKLTVPLGTIKTRIRLGLMKIRDRLRELMGEAAVDDLSSEERV